MFHTYVTASSRNVVDIDRATFLMDDNLWSETLAAMRVAKRANAAQWA